MNARRLFTAFALLGMCLGAARPAGAHRVDEYLQASRIAVGLDRVDLEIDLTPGMTVASRVARWIDTNGDGQISAAEADVYAQDVLRSVVLSVDGRRVPIALVDIHVPQLREMSLGVGTILLRATAKVSATGFGRHQLAFSNTHRPESSVYLVNALVPADSRIQVGAQRRDSEQHDLAFDYTVAPDARWASFLVIGVAICGVLAMSILPRPVQPS